jgi:hypothetical protein
MAKVDEEGVSTHTYAASKRGFHEPEITAAYSWFGKAPRLVFKELLFSIVYHANSLCLLPTRRSPVCAV